MVKTKTYLALMIILTLLFVPIACNNKEPTTTDIVNTETPPTSPPQTKTPNLTPTPTPMTLYDEQTNTTLTFTTEPANDPTLQPFATFPPHPPEYALLVEKNTTMDEQGNPTITYTYVLPYDTDIWDVAKKVLLINGVQYGYTDVEQPQKTTVKTVNRSQICATAEEAGEFPKTIEYNSYDGNGILEIDPSTISVEVNETTGTPYTVSATKTYRMEFRDDEQIPQTISSAGYTLSVEDVSWTEIDDPEPVTNEMDVDGDEPETEIDETELGSDAESNDIATRFWLATVRYSTTAYDETSSYIGTVLYEGKILVKNSPENTFIITYKPDTPIKNISGLYKENSENSYYNGQITQLNAEDQEFIQGLYGQVVDSNFQATQKAEDLQVRANTTGSNQPLAVLGIGTSTSLNIENRIQTMFLLICILFLSVSILTLVIVYSALRNGKIVKKKKRIQKQSINDEKILLNETKLVAAGGMRGVSPRG